MKVLVYPSETFSEIAVAEKNIEAVYLSKKVNWAFLIKMKSGRILAVSRENPLIKRLNPNKLAIVKKGEIVVI